MSDISLKLHYLAYTLLSACISVTLMKIPANIPINFTSPETRGIVLPAAENRTIVSLFVWTKHRNVTEWQTERQTEMA